MKKTVIFAAAMVVLAVLALRRFGPTLGKRAMHKCQEMFEGRSGEVSFEDECKELASSIAR